MTTNYTAKRNDSIIDELLSECKERKPNRVQISYPMSLRFDAYRINGRKFTIHGVTFQPIPDLFGFGTYSDFKVTKGEKEYKREHWTLALHLAGLWVDPEECDI